MSRRNGSVLGWLLSLAIPFGVALAADAETSTWVRVFRPAHTNKRAASSPKPTASDPLAQRQVIVRHIGFEAQQQGYAAKVQGSASQNILWVTPQEQPHDPARRSWLAPWRDFFDLSD